MQSVAAAIVTAPSEGHASSTGAPGGEASAARGPIEVQGKFFFAGGKKHVVKGVTYGPFAPAPLQCSCSTQPLSSLVMSFVPSGWPVALSVTSHLPSPNMALPLN